MGIADIANIARQSMLNYQSALNTTSENIANVNTDGYKRRRIDLTKYTVGYSTMNGGLTSSNVLRMRQKFVEDQLYMENERSGQYSMDEQILSRVENIMGTASDNGLSDLLDQFWNSWEDLTNNPESQSMRTVIRNKAISVATWFNRVHSDIKTLKTQVRGEVQDTVQQANQYLNQIAELNKSIQSNQDNDLLDQRDILLDSLSSLMNIDILEKDDGTVTISTNGQMLVSGTSAYMLNTSVQTTEGKTKVQIARTVGNRVLNITSGKLGSQVKNHNDRINGYLDDLNTLASSLATIVNSVHKTGYDQNGNTGINFFEAGITNAGDFAVSSDILNNASLIASASVTDDPGNNDIASRIAALRDNTSMPGSVTLGEFYNILQGKVGQDLQNAQFSNSNQTKIVDSLKNQMEATSGVSIDEEMTNLLQFQQGYQAAAKLVNTVSDFAQTIMNMV